MSHPICRSKLAELDAVRRAKAEYDALSIEGQLNEKLDRLQAFIEQLDATPSGKIELARRTGVLGTCVRRIDENSREYYGRLRHWLDSTLPP